MSAKKQTTRFKLQPKLPIVIAAFLFAFVGFHFFISSQAATFTSSKEVENGTISGSAVVKNYANASGGQGVKFGGVPLAISIAGNHFVNQYGQTVRLIGVNQFGKCADGTVLHGDTDQAAVDNLLKYHINTVRLIMNEDCWLGINGLPGGGLTSAQLKSKISAYIDLLNKNGIFVVFDLHTNAPNGNCPDTGGICVSNGQQVMADADHALDYWTSVANNFKDNPAVIFEAYNEPHPSTDDTKATDPWKCWRDGCTATVYNYTYDGPKINFDWQTVGMQQIVNTIRNTGAHNVISLGGLSFSNNLNHFLDNDANGKPYLPNDPDNQISASFHNYKGWGCGDTSCWDNNIAPVANKMPVITTEFGQHDCSHDFLDTWFPWADKHGISYTAWVWVAGTCDPNVNGGFSGSWGLLKADGTTPNSYGINITNHYKQVN
ncbi:MAG TPA: cellulase family glycosylhydrolase [Candidatus Saccharimonadales bacterium]|nr:cellulase family glycosylhydrolase [Candidatus Saccharimonadales bacterium]